MRTRIDFIGRKDGVLYLYEVKNGMYARPTPNQKIAIPLLENLHQPFIPAGRNALQIPEFRSLVPYRFPYEGDYIYIYQHYK